MIQIARVIEVETAQGTEIAPYVAATRCGLSHFAWLHGGDARCTDSGPSRRRAWRLVLLGPPGIGKGTQAGALVSQLGACHLSTGEVFRQAAREETATLITAMHRGELVSDEAVIELVRKRTHCLKCSRGFLLDGYPRTLAQARSLDTLLADLNVDLDAVVHFHAPERVLLERLAGRRVCMKCGAGFHLEHSPPSRAGRCDLCGNLLSQREDDEPDAVRIRLRSYAATIAPVLDHYRGLGLLHEIDAAAPSETVLARTVFALDATVRRRRD